MNSAPNQSNNFNSQPATGTQANPFTADLKGEFTSNFGTNTNAVSQIFKDGSFANQNRTRNIVIGAVVVLALVGAGWFFMMDETSTDDSVAEEGAPVDENGEAAPPVPADAAATAAAAAAAAVPVAETPAVDPGAAPVASGAITLTAPENGASLAYDETQGSATFSWEGGPGTIVFSRQSSMKPETMRVKVSGSTYAFHHPWPGQWFWKIENDAGMSEPRSFTVSAPIRRNVALTAPAAGGSIAGTGGVVSWTGDKGVAYYRVELNQGDDWSNPQFKFSSSGSQAQLNAVPAGSYSMRLGAFSEVSGRWEYTAVTPVTVQ
jgi:hypothetical protein